jgi:hypothetical protein
VILTLGAALPALWPGPWPAPRLALWPGLWPADVPVDPSSPEAQQWLREELAKPPYQAATPTWFDRLSQGFFDWLGSFTLPSGDGWGGWVPLILTLVVVAVLVAAFLIFGLPRLNRRSALSAEVSGSLFGLNDRRSADEMRRAARAAAAAGDWSLASQEAYRALARGLAERTVLLVSPGTTAHDFAVRASVAFPLERERLVTAAAVFDQVRYLGSPGTAQGYQAVTDLDAALARSRPAVLADIGERTNLSGPADRGDRGTTQTRPREQNGAPVA